MKTEPKPWLDSKRPAFSVHPVRAVATERVRKAGWCLGMRKNHFWVNGWCYWCGKKRAGK